MERAWVLHHRKMLGTGMVPQGCLSQRCSTSVSETSKARGVLSLAIQSLSKMWFRKDCFSLQAQSLVTILRLLKSHHKSAKSFWAPSNVARNIFRRQDLLLLQLVGDRSWVTGLGFFKKNLACNLFPFINRCSFFFRLIYILCSQPRKRNEYSPLCAWKASTTDFNSLHSVELKIVQSQTALLWSQWKCCF